MNELKSLADVLRAKDNEVLVDFEVGRQAVIPLQRMLDFNKLSVS